jgi:nucleotide-binding universal stress UspA family protein
MAKLTPHCQALEAAGFTASIEVRVGHPQHEIDRLIEEAPIDLIAMTTHGHSGLRHMLMGSIAQHLLRHSALPLLVYRPFGYQ